MKKLKGKVFTISARSVGRQILTGFLKTIVVLFLILFIFFFIIPQTLSLFLGKDAPSVNETDLQLENIDLPEEENMFYELDKIKDVISHESNDDIVSDYLDFSKWTEKELTTIIDNNQTALEYFDEAARKDSFLLPIMARPNEISVNSPVYPMNSWRQISRVASLKAQWLIKSGEDSLAFQEAEKIIKVGHAIESSQVSIIGYLVGIAVEKTGLETMQKLILETSLNPSQLEYYRQNLGDIEIRNNISPLISEYLYGKDSIKRLDSGEESSSFLGFFGSFALKNNYYFKPKQTIQMAASEYQKIIENFQNSCLSQGFVESKTFLPTSIVAFPKLYFTENVVGKLLFSSHAVALNNVKTKRCELQTNLTATKFMFSLKQYFLNNGNYPTTLKILVPTYVSDIPKDSMSGDAYRYDPRFKLLFSAGRDHVFGTSDDVEFSIKFD